MWDKCVLFSDKIRLVTLFPVGVTDVLLFAYGCKVWLLPSITVHEQKRLVLYIKNITLYCICINSTSHQREFFYIQWIEWVSGLDIFCTHNIISCNNKIYEKCINQTLVYIAEFEIAKPLSRQNGSWSEAYGLSSLASFGDTKLIIAIFLTYTLTQLGMLVNIWSYIRSKSESVFKMWFNW